MAIEDTKSVQKIEAKAGGKSGTYWTVTWADGKHDNLFDKALMDKCEEAQSNNLAVHYTKEKREGSRYFNIVSLNLVKDKLPPPQKPTSPPLQPGEPIPKKSKEQEIAEHVWWKELGSMIRAKDIDLDKPAGKLMRAAYYAKMLSVLDIKIKDKAD